jgi:hypothetical protein
MTPDQTDRAAKALYAVIFIPRAENLPPTNQAMATVNAEWGQYQKNVIEAVTRDALFIVEYAFEDLAVSHAAADG